jgi:hypothetical protein
MAWWLATWQWRFPPLAVPPSRSARVRTVESVAQAAVANLVVAALAPTSSLYGTIRRGPTSQFNSWTPPIRVRSRP